MKIHNEHLLPPSRPPETPAEPSPHAAAHLAWVARTVPCPAGCRDENLDCDVCFGRCRVDPVDAEMWTGALKIAREAGYAAGQKAERERCAELCRLRAGLRWGRARVLDGMGRRLDGAKTYAEGYEAQACADDIASGATEPQLRG